MKPLIPWTTWQKRAWIGDVKESDEDCPRPSGIACPIKDEHGKECGNNMTDTNAIVECGSEARRVVHCTKCGAWMCRILGTGPLKKKPFSLWGLLPWGIMLVRMKS